jgi:hypothetical protein
MMSMPDHNLVRLLIKHPHQHYQELADNYMLSLVCTDHAPDIILGGKTPEAGIQLGFVYSVLHCIPSV